MYKRGYGRNRVMGHLNDMDKGEKRLGGKSLQVRSKHVGHI
jgi:hypothetical protein